MKFIRRIQMAFYDYDLTDQIAGQHELWEIDRVVVFSSLLYRFKDMETGVGRSGFGIEVGIKALYLQFHYDLSDRELEKRLRFDLGFRWFCGFTAFETTPDHTFFCRFRKLMGAKRVGQLFKAIVKRAEKDGLLRSVFRFADATAVITKQTTWEERDKALSGGEDALNNSNIKKYSADSEARFGCKGKSKFWFGYKGHVSVDMGSGLIERIAATPANISDQEGFSHVCPRGGEMVFADKAYCLGKAQTAMKIRSATSAAILKNNMKNKNKDLDRWRSGIRAPFESVFSKFERRARYRSLAKVQLQLFMEAIVHNMKRLVQINPPPLPIGA
jgi:IS5 family transposase